MEAFHAVAFTKFVAIIRLKRFASCRQMAFAARNTIRQRNNSHRIHGAGAQFKTYPESVGVFAKRYSKYVKTEAIMNSKATCRKKMFGDVLR